MEKRKGLRVDPGGTPAEGQWDLVHVPLTMYLKGLPRLVPAESWTRTRTRTRTRFCSGLDAWLLLVHVYIQKFKKRHTSVGWGWTSQTCLANVWCGHNACRRVEGMTSREPVIVWLEMRREAPCFDGGSRVLPSGGENRELVEPVVICSLQRWMGEVEAGSAMTWTVENIFSESVWCIQGLNRYTDLKLWLFLVSVWCLLSWLLLTCYLFLVLAQNNYCARFPHNSVSSHYSVLYK